MYLIFTVVFGRFRSAAEAPGGKLSRRGLARKLSVRFWGCCGVGYRNWLSSSGIPAWVPVPNLRYRYPRGQNSGLSPVYRYPLWGTGTPLSNCRFWTRLGFFERGFMVNSLMGYFELCYSVLLLLYSLLLSPHMPRMIKKKRKERKQEEKREEDGRS